MPNDYSGTAPGRKPSDMERADHIFKKYAVEVAGDYYRRGTGADLQAVVP